MPSSISNSAPLLLTCGDPNGIGLDITGSAFDELCGTIPLVLIADSRHIIERITSHQIEVIDDLSEYKYKENSLTVLHHEFPEMPSLDGPQYINARAIIEVIEKAMALSIQGKASAIITNPIHKHVLQKGAQFAFPGHTEFLAHLGKRETSVMMLAARELRVVPVTIHVPLSEAPALLTQKLLRDTISITIADLQEKFKLNSPRIAVAGLNPHAGENGAFGREEIDIIQPVIDEFKQQGVGIFGPLSADTMFHEEARSHYDCAICMYHDQALIPLKTLDFHGGVNVTLGLPFIRTSPDHGTAFDLAGTRRANPQSLINAIKLAHELSA